MINKRKVRLMARTAMYLKHEGTEDIPKSKYYRKDYVSLHMWLTAIAVTIAYFLLLILIACCNFEKLINSLTTMNYTVLLVVIILGYVAMMVVFMFIAYFVYSYRYTESENGIKVYQNRLAKIYKLNKEDMKKIK